MLSILSIVVALQFAQFVWILHNNSKFNTYKKMWEAAYAKWNEAHRQGDEAAMQAAYQQQSLAQQAEQAVHRDNFLPPWLWIKRWNHDYLPKV